MKHFVTLFLLLALAPGLLRGQAAPEKMSFCGMELTLTPEARTRVSELVAQIQASPRYYNEMLRRARLYLPFVEEAFQAVRVPADLKYLVIVESSLRPDAVSTSEAVGFWQFKAPTAIALGLIVNEEVDERKHIFRSSEAAARYLLSAYLDFDNWLYAAIAYKEGPTGAVKFTDPQYYGAERMTIDASLNPYVLKLLAHKLAYEGPLAERLRPEQFLSPFSTLGETDLREIMSRHEVSELDFWGYNKWIGEMRRLPKGTNFTYYIPTPGELYVGHIPDPNKQQAAGLAEIPPAAPAIQQAPSTPEPSLPSLPEPAMPPARRSPLAVYPAELGRSDYVEFYIRNDLHYGQQYVLSAAGQDLQDMADQFGLRYSDLLAWNGWTPGHAPAPGTLVYLQKPTKLLFHIVRKGESLASIAELRATSMGKLVKINHIAPVDPTIYIGQKLYLKGKKAPGEKQIVLIDTEPLRERPREAAPAPPGPSLPAEPASQPVAVPAPQRSLPPSDDTGKGPVAEVQTRWVEHTVSPGETLWQIAKLYNTKVEIIKMINKLENDQISEGLRLRILARN